MTAGGGSLTGLGRLTRLILRRDRLRIPLWIGGVVAMVLVSGWSLRSVYGTPEAIRRYVDVADDNPALVVFAGPGHGFDDPNIGVVLVNETLLWGALSTALMGIFVVIRHTRAEEDGERTELLRSGVVGRHAPVAAAFLTAGAMNFAVFALVAIGLVWQGYPAAGSVALAASVALAGVVYTGVGAVAAQVMGSARGALGWASTALGITFAIRAIGDVGDNWVSWASPLGWSLAIRAFADESWWTLLLSAGFAVMLAGSAFALSTRRDLGSGLVAQRAGPARAARWMISPAGLALRLQRATIVGWSLGLLVTGLVFGSVGDDVARLLEDNPQLAEYLARFGGSSITDAYFATAFQMMALLASGFAVSSILRARSEEIAGRTEPVIATPTSRTAWWLGQLIVTVVGTCVVVLAGGLGVGAAYGIVAEDGGQVMRMLAASLTTLPAIFVLVGLALALFGFVPRSAMLVWVVFAMVTVIGVLAETLRVPRWVRDLSPFEHLPPAPAGGLELAPLVALTATAALLMLLGWRGFCRRDLATT